MIDWICEYNFEKVGWELCGSIRRDDIRIYSSRYLKGTRPTYHAMWKAINAIEKDFYHG